jgi:Xaa-Pro aminopeptidase
MKYLPIDPSLYVQNRTQFAKQLKANSLAVFNANDILPTNADGHMPFRQNNDLLYLSGIDQEETILLLFPDSPNPAHREILFVRETSAEIAVWEGAKFTKEQATKASGIATVYWLQEFQKVFNVLMSQTKHVYLNSNEHQRAAVEVETREVRFNSWCQKNYPLHRYERSAPIMHQLRSVKSAIEIDLMQQACDITSKGFRRVLQMVKPGVTEYEIEAEWIHEFIRNRSDGFAYQPIVASGSDSCVLHYISNNKVCQDGDILLMDVGASYANYASDLSRSIPVNGRFSPRQTEVYNAVLRVMKAATQLLVPGNTLENYHAEVGRLMETELIGLKLLDAAAVKNQDPKFPLYKKYFMHGTSHFIGLDVHDVGHWHLPMQEGNVFTCEPGIYIKEEGLGIRIENDILITANGPVDLMKSIPVEIEEIEEIMNA